MIVLPDIRPRRLRKLHARYGRFLAGVHRGADGLKAVELAPAPLAQTVPEIDYSTSPASVPFVSGERYFVIGSCDCSTFTIIDRSPRRECSGVQSLPQTKICIPEFVAQVLVHNDQIFFRAASAIYVYTGDSTSQIAAAALDMCVDRRLYVLCADRILVYDEALAATISLTPGASRIAAAGGAVFVARGSVLYKVVDGFCVFTHDCVHAVAALATDGSRLYALSTNGTLTSVALFSHVVHAVETHVEQGRLHLVGSFVVLHNGRNGCVFFTRDTLCLVHSELLDTACTALSCTSSSISYLCQGAVLTHVCSQAEGTASPRANGRTGFFEALRDAAPGSEENDLDRELQELMSREEHAEVDAPAAACCNTERLSALLSEYGAGDGPSAESSDGTFYFSDEKGDQAIAGYLERVMGSGAGAEQPACAADKPCGKTDRAPPRRSTNPPTPLPPARAVFAGPDLIVTRFSPDAPVYRRSGFFVENHVPWFAARYSAAPGPEVPLGYAVYEHIERIAVPKRAAHLGHQKPRAQNTRRTHRSGGF